MERLPVLDPLHFNIVTFAGYVMEYERPDEGWDNELHPEYRSAFRNEKIFIQDMIETLKYDLENEHVGLEHFQSPQQCRTKLLVWSKYSDIFNSTYPLILQDAKAALQILAFKAPSSFWKIFWSWISDCNDEILQHDQLVEYLCHEVVPELCSEPLQRQACYEAWNEVKAKLMDHEMQSMAITMALQATGLSHDIPPAYLLASRPTG